MYKYILLMLALPVQAGPYAEVGLGIPISPQTGYIPDEYAILSIGYLHPIDNVLSIDTGLVHRSETGMNTCNGGPDDCHGDFAIEAKLRYEW